MGACAVRKKGGLILLLSALLTVSGCVSVTEHGRVNGIKQAYLVRNEYLVVCMDGVILGKRGEYFIELPLNGTLLHPSNAVRSFAPVSYQDIIPQFAIPLSLIKEKCIPEELGNDRIPVPVVGNWALPTVAVGENGKYSTADVESAAITYLNSLRSRDIRAGTVYVPEKTDGEILPNFFYASDRSLYGNYQAVSFLTPSRQVKAAPDSILPVIFAPVAVLAVAGMATGYALDSKLHNSSASLPQKVPKGPASIDDSDLLKLGTDQRLDGHWRSIGDTEDSTRVGGVRSRKDRICVLDFVGHRIKFQCSGSLGDSPPEAWVYGLREQGRYEFLVTDSSASYRAPGLRGLADYRWEGERLVVTSRFDDPSDIHWEKIVYVRDLPRLLDP